MAATATITSLLDSPVTATNVVAASNLDNVHSIAVYPLEAGAEGTYQTLDAMAACVRGECPPDFSGYHDEYVRRKAEELVRNVPSQNSEKEVRALFEFVRDRLKYQKHPINQQRIQDCRRTLEIGSGDCVSKSVCLATLLAALGYECRFVAQNPTGEEYTHVYVEVLDDSGEWRPLDPVAEHKPMGWTQPLFATGHETPWAIF